MKRIALTGSIACGKSLAAKFLNSLGVETLDADDIVHEIIPDAEERKRIAAEVFADPEKRRALEERVHPIVKKRILDWLDEPRSPSSPPRLAVIPLLYESGWEGDFDFIGCVVASRSEQIRRLVESRGYTREEAVARLAAQIPAEEKARKADFVVRNDSSPAELRGETARFVAEISRLNLV